MKQVYELAAMNEVEAFLEHNKLCLLYVSRPECSVCHALLPKLKKLLADYPHIHFGHVNANQVEAVAAKFLAFTAPTILLIMEQKEYFRAHQFIRFEQLQEQLERIYPLALSEE